MAFLDDVASFVASACSLTVGTTLFKGKLPASPDTCAAVVEYSGAAPEYRIGGAAVRYEHPRVQVLFRGAPADYTTPRATAETAYRAFGAAATQSISSTRYLSFDPVQSPFPLLRDDKDRVVVGFNVQIEKDLSA